jgi:hypothetical protein
MGRLQLRWRNQHAVQWNEETKHGLIHEEEGDDDDYIALELAASTPHNHLLHICS